MDVITGVSDGVSDTSGITVGERSAVGVLVSVEDANGLGVLVSFVSVTTAEGVSISVAVGEMPPGKPKSFI